MEGDSQLASYTFTQVKAFHILELSSSIVSVVVGTIALVLWFRMDPSRRVIFRLELLLFLILSDYLKAFYTLCYASKNLDRLIKLASTNDSANSRLDAYISQPRYCDGWGFLKQMATISADLTIMTLTGHNALMIFKPSLSKLHEKKPMNFTKMVRKTWLYLKSQITFREIFQSDPRETVIVNEGGVYPLRWYILIVITLISNIFSGLIFVNGGHYIFSYSCSAPQKPVWKRLCAGWIIRYVNLISIVLVYTFIIVYLQYYSQDIERSKKKLLQPKSFKITNNSQHLNDVQITLQKDLMDITNDTNSKRRSSVKRELKSFAIYPIGYCLIWITPTINQIYNYFNKRGPFGLLAVATFTIPLSCAIDTVIFCVREKPWHATSSKIKMMNKTAPYRAADVFQDNRQEPDVESQPLGIQHAPELQTYNPSPNGSIYGKEGSYKERQNSWASSYMSTIRVLIGSKKGNQDATTISPQQKQEDRKRTDGNSSSASDETATSQPNMNDQNDPNDPNNGQEESDSIDMIEFLRGRY